MKRIHRNRGVALTVVLAAALVGGCGDKPAATDNKAEKKAQADQPDAQNEAPEPKKDLPEAQVLIDAHIEAIGGKDAIAKFETLYFESAVDTGAQNIKASAKTWWKGGHFYGEQEIPGFGVAKSGYDGNVVWVDDPINGLRKLEGKEAEQIIREGAIFLVSEWEQHFSDADTVDDREVDGVKLYDVQLKSKLGDEVVMSFNVEDKLLSRMQFQQITPTGTIPVTAVFEDYRDVQGVKFAHRSRLEIALGTVTQSYSKIEANGPVDETRFAFPGSAAAVPAAPPAEPENAQAPQPGG